MAIASQAHSAHGIKWLGHSELGGRSDGVQVMVNKGYAFVGHPFSGGGATVVTSVIRAIRSR